MISKGNSLTLCFRRCFMNGGISSHSLITSKCCYSQLNDFPEHVGIVMDGNRRYAKNCLKSLRPWDGHKSGTATLETLLRGIIDDRTFIKELSLYCFSKENFNRSENEVRSLLDLFNENLKKIRNEEEIYKIARLKFIGNLENFEEVEETCGLDYNLHGQMDLIEEETKDNTGLIVNFCCGYGGRSEIIGATRNFGKKIYDAICEGESDIEAAMDLISNLDEDNFREYLGVESDPNLIVRTGGRMRTSNFLPFQSTYTEWFFLNILWPEFTLEHLDDVIDEYVTERKITNGE